jgi:ribonuclease HII
MPIKKQRIPLKAYYCLEDTDLEIGIDEAGRGPMFGRVYAAAVILPKDDSFQHKEMKDSKKFHSEKKINAIADYIKDNAISWGIGYSTEQEIDSYNIRKATHMAMHKAIKQVTEKISTKESFHLLVDGNDFTIYNVLNGQTLTSFKHTCIKGGDDKYTSIAAASILAKVERDCYIKQLCENDPSLIEKYDILNNKGYGTKNHMNGILEYGITKYHRKTFGICKSYS